MQRSGSMSRPRGRDARCSRLERGGAASLCNLRRVQGAKGSGQRGPRRLDLGSSDTRVWSCPRSPSRFVLSGLLTRSKPSGGRALTRFERMHAVQFLLVVQRRPTGDLRLAQATPGVTLGARSDLAERPDAARTLACKILGLLPGSEKRPPSSTSWKEYDVRVARLDPAARRPPFAGMFSWSRMGSSAAAEAGCPLPPARRPPSTYGAPRCRSASTRLSPSRPWSRVRLPEGCLSTKCVGDLVERRCRGRPSTRPERPGNRAARSQSLAGGVAISNE